MAIYDLRKKTQASTGQRTIKDESSCNCSEKIVELQRELQLLKSNRSWLSLNKCLKERHAVFITKSKFATE